MIAVASALEPLCTWSPAELLETALAPTPEDDTRDALLLLAFTWTCEHPGQMSTENIVIAASAALTKPF